MKIIIFCILLCTSCSDPKIIELHKAAKDNPDSKVCYTIYQFEEISGRYCLKYEGLP